MEDSKIYVYAPSMAIVTWAARRWLWNDITIISSNFQIIKFCLKCGISVIEIKSNEDSSFKGLVNHKKYIVEFAKQFSKCSFIFGHNSHDYWGLFLLNCISKNGNSIYYNSQLQEHPKLSFLKKMISRKNRRLFLDTLILRLVLKKKFDVLSFGEYSFIGIDIERILKKFAKNLTPVSDEIFSLNQNHVIIEYNIVDIKIILIDQGEAFYKYPDELIECLISFSKRHNGFYLKQHPSFKTKNVELLDQLNQVPDEIPAELFVDNNIIIGIASTVIKSNKKCISLIHLVEIDDDVVQRYVNFLGSNTIFYPKSILELETIVKKLISV